MARALVLLPWLAFLLVAASVPAQAAFKQRDFVISFWWPPPPAETNEARIRQIADAGFTVYMGGNGVDGPELNRQVLDLCEKAGLRAMVLDSRVHGGKPEGVEAVVKDYADHPALYGYLVKDEPNTSEFPALGRVVEAFAKQDPKHLAYINLLPTYANQQQLGASTYEQYVRQYLETVKPDVLCYDHYPLLTQGLRPDFYTNLDTIRKEALRANVPFWAFVQAEGIEGAYRSPSPTEMRWQAFQSLAYGARGILYFTYWTPQPGVEKHFDGILAPDGKARARYSAVKEINADIRGLGPTLMTTRTLEVYHVGAPTPGSRDLDSENGLFLLSALGDPATLAYLRGPSSKRYAFVVNRDPNRSALLKLRFRDNVERCYEILKTGKRGENLLHPDLRITPEVEVNLDAGDGRLFEIGVSNR